MVSHGVDDIPIADLLLIITRRAVACSIMNAAAPPFWTKRLKNGPSHDYSGANDTIAGTCESD